MATHLDENTSAADGADVTRPSRRSVRWTVTSSPVPLWIAARVAVVTASLCLPSPRAMKAPRKGWPSTDPATLTRPRVPKYSALQSVTRWVQPPSASLEWK